MVSHRFFAPDLKIYNYKTIVFEHRGRPSSKLLFLVCRKHISPNALKHNFLSCTIRRRKGWPLNFFQGCTSHARFEPWKFFTERNGSGMNMRQHHLSPVSRIYVGRDPLLEEVMDYRTYCCASAKDLVQKPSWDFLLKQGLIRNVKWNYREGMSISGLWSLPRFSRKSQLGFCTRSLALAQQKVL